MTGQRWIVQDSASGVVLAELHGTHFSRVVATRLAQRIAEAAGASQVSVSLRVSPIGNPTLVHHGRARKADWHIVDSGTGHAALADLYNTPSLATAKKIARAIAAAKRGQVVLLDNTVLMPSLITHSGIRLNRKRPLSRATIRCVPGTVTASGRGRPTAKRKGRKRNPSRSSTARHRRKVQRKFYGSARQERAYQGLRRARGTSGELSALAKLRHRAESTARRIQRAAWRRPNPMSRLGSEKAAISAARDYGQSYGRSVLDGAFYVGTPADLKKIGVVDVRQPNPKGRFTVRKIEDLVHSASVGDYTQAIFEVVDGDTGKAVMRSYNQRDARTEAAYRNKHDPRGAFTRARVDLPARRNRRRIAHHASVAPVFGKPWETLSLNEVTAVLKDIAELADDEMESDDIAAARELRTRIGGANVIKSYAQSLVAGGRHLNPATPGRAKPRRHTSARRAARGVRRPGPSRKRANPGGRFTRQPAIIAKIADHYYVLRAPGIVDIGGRSKASLAAWARTHGFAPTYVDERKPELRALPFANPRGRKAALSHRLIGPIAEGGAYYFHGGRLASDGWVEMTQAQWNKVHRDYKGTAESWTDFGQMFGAGTKSIMVREPAGSALRPVRIVGKNPRMSPTEAIARAAAWDAGNRHAKAAGRKKWSRADYNVAVRELDRLLGPASPNRRRKGRSSSGAGRGVRGMGRSNPRNQELARARRTFRRLNEMEPGPLTRVRGAKGAPRVAVRLGELVSFKYRSDKYAGSKHNPHGKTLLYEHTTRRPRPVLASDPGGEEVHIVGGRMHPSPDGLVN